MADTEPQRSPQKTTPSPSVEVLHDIDPAAASTAIASGGGEEGWLDAARFTDYYLAARPSLRAFLTTLIFDHAAVEDCLQETCLLLWKKKAPHWTLEDFRKIAFTTARFKALSWLKKNKPAAHLSLSPELSEQLAARAADAPAVALRNMQTDRMEALRQCLRTLSNEQRQLVNARYDADSNDALARAAKSQNRTLDAIYKQLERVRTALRKCVQNRLTQNEP